MRVKYAVQIFCHTALALIKTLLHTKIFKSVCEETFLASAKFTEKLKDCTNLCGPQKIMSANYLKKKYFKGSQTSKQKTAYTDLNLG